VALATTSTRWITPLNEIPVFAHGESEIKECCLTAYKERSWYEPAISG